MALFNPDNFLKEVPWEVFDTLTKPKLIQLAQYCEIEFKSSMRKQQIKNLLIDYFVDDGLLEESSLDMKKSLHVDSDPIRLKEPEIEQLKVQNVQILEQKRIEAEESCSLKSPKLVMHQSLHHTLM